MELESIYTVYFEIFGKKMKAKVLASSVEDAKQKIADNIIFHKTEKESGWYNDIVDKTDDLMRSLGIK